MMGNGEAGFFTARQDQILSTARKNLERDNAVQPMAFVFTEKRNLPSKIKGGAFEFLGEEAEFKAAGGDATAMLILPMPPPARQLIEAVLEDTVPKEKLQFALKTLPEVIELGAIAAGSLEKAERKTLEILLRSGGLSEKDAAFIYLRRFMAKVKAKAWIHVMEGYFLRTPEESHAEARKRADEMRSLADDPAATECVVCSLETYAGNRVVHIPFTRTVRNTGQVDKIEKPIDSGLTMAEGRMFGLLPPIGDA